jgi:imidazolonepropionase
MRWTNLWIDTHLATFAKGDGPYGIVENGAIAAIGENIAWVGATAGLPGAPQDLAETVHRLDGQWLTPGLVDCHTHLIFGGNRAHEFEQRLTGVSYEEIARQGGGINSTVRATRAADEDELVTLARPRLNRLLSEGVTTIEVKSGYGLDLETEIRMLRAARRLGNEAPVTLRTSFLGAHTFPSEFRDRPDAYIDLICNEMLPRVADLGLADAVDAFCEGIALSPEQTERVFRAAGQHGLPVKLHADQLSDLGGAALAAQFGALSADHLEYTSDAGAQAMAKAGTVAVLLPGAFFTLRESQAPPIESFRRHRVPMAIATDCNPGSAPVLSLLLMLNMACTLFRLTPAEALAGVTHNAAKALGLEDRLGSLEVGKRADFAIWDVNHPGELCYWVGGNPCVSVVRGGK